MKTEANSAWAIEDRRSFQLSIAAVYSPLMLLLMAAVIVL